MLQRQLVLLAHVARKGDDDPLRNMVFKPSSVELRAFPGKRKRGRPRLNWPTEVYKHAVKACELNGLSLEDIARDDVLSANAWKRAAQLYSSSL